MGPIKLSFLLIGAIAGTTYLYSLTLPDVPPTPPPPPPAKQRPTAAELLARQEAAERAFDAEEAAWRKATRSSRDGKPRAEDPERTERASHQKESKPACEKRVDNMKEKDLARAELKCPSAFPDYPLSIRRARAELREVALKDDKIVGCDRKSPRSVQCGFESRESGITCTHFWKVTWPSWRVKPDLKPGKDYCFEDEVKEEIEREAGI